MIKKTAEQILMEVQSKLSEDMLKNNIKSTLFYFIAMDLKIYGHIVPSTLKAFKYQNVPFPKELRKFIKKK